MRYEIETREIMAILKRIAADAFEAGRQQGADETRNAIFHQMQTTIFNQASVPEGLLDGRVEHPPRSPMSAPLAPPARAPRGLVGQVLEKIFSEHPNGISNKDLVRLAIKADERIAEKSIYNTLSRGRADGKYGRDGKLWFMMPDFTKINSAENSVRAESSADDSRHSDGEHDDTTNMTS